MANDALQQSFLKIHQNLHNIGDDVQDPKTLSYISVITRHVAYDLFTKRAKEQAVTISGKEELSLVENIVDQAPQPDEVLAQAELRQDTKKLFEQLPPNQRDVLILRYYHDLSYQEISRTLGISEAAVRQRVSRAKTKLADLIMETGKSSYDEE